MDLQGGYESFETLQGGETVSFEKGRGRDGKDKAVDVAVVA